MTRHFRVFSWFYIFTTVCFSILIIVYLSISRDNKNLRYDEKLECNLESALNADDAYRLKKLAARICSIEHEVSKQYTETISNNTDINFYMQKKFPDLRELQEESLIILNKINSPFFISLLISLFLSDDNYLLSHHLNFTGDGKIKVAIEKFTEQTNQNRHLIMFIIKPLLLSNLKLCIFLNEDEMVCRILEQSLQIMSNIREISSLSLVVKIGLVQDILSCYNNSREKLKKREAEICDEYVSRMLQMLFDDTSKLIIILKNSILVAIPYYYAVPDNDRARLLSVFEQILAKLIEQKCDNCYTQVIDGIEISFKECEINFDFYFYNEIFVLIKSIKHYQSILENSPVQLCACPMLSLSNECPQSGK